MLTLNPQTCTVEDKMDALELWWLDQAVYREIRERHYSLRCINVRPGIIETANGFVLHQVVGKHNSTSGTYIVDCYKKVTKSRKSHTVALFDGKTNFPDTDRITTPVISNANWILSIAKSELLWALDMPDALTCILVISAHGFAVKHNSIAAYLPFKVLTQPAPLEGADKPAKLRIAVDPKFLTAAANLPTGDDVLLSFIDATHPIVVQSTDSRYRAIVMPMHLGR